MILVTGGTGLVGSHLLYHLAQSGQNIRAIYRSKEKLKKVKEVFEYYTSSANATSLFNKIEWKQTYLNDIPELEENFKGVDRVYHCAALISFDPADKKELRKSNIEGTANIVNLCIAHQVDKLCYVSSIASLGKNISGAEITEKTTWNPEEDHSDYAISKYGAETEVWRGSQEGLKVVIVNPGIILGPGFWESGSGLFFSKIARGLKFYFTKTSGFVGVGDVVDAMLLLMNSEIKNEKFILVAENLSFREILDKVAESIQKPKPRIRLKRWMLWTGWFFQKIGSLFGLRRKLTSETVNTLFEDRYYSNEKIREELSFSFTPITKVINETGIIFKKTTASG